MSLIAVGYSEAAFLQGKRLLCALREIAIFRCQASGGLENSVVRLLAKGLL